MTRTRTFTIPSDLGDVPGLRDELVRDGQDAGLAPDELQPSLMELTELVNVAIERATPARGRWTVSPAGVRLEMPSA